MWRGRNSLQTVYIYFVNAIETARKIFVVISSINDTFKLSLLADLNLPAILRGRKKLCLSRSTKHKSTEDTEEPASCLSRSARSKAC